MLSRIGWGILKTTIKILSFEKERHPLLTGKRFRLERATLAIDGCTGKRRAVTIPVGAVIKVVVEPNNDDGMVDVLWQGMFAIDVEVRGTEITETDRAYLRASG